jgi:hypothetical protein
VRWRVALTLWPLAWTAGCAGFESGRFRTVEVTAPVGSSLWRGLPLREGQIIVIEQDEPQSFLLALLAEEYRPFVHAGLVVLDGGEPRVYEAWAIYKPRLGGRPTRDPGGGVRSVPLESFLRRDGIIAIHDPPPGVEGARAAAFARANLRVPFDEFFDARTPGAFYCAEFVARALEAGGAPGYSGTAVSGNPSVRTLLRWFEVSAPRLLLAGDLLHDTQRRALIDRVRGPQEIERHFAERRELHRRFTPDQKLGNVFRWNGVALRWRPTLERALARP